MKDDNIAILDFGSGTVFITKIPDDVEPDNVEEWVHENYGRETQYMVGSFELNITL